MPNQWRSLLVATPLLAAGPWLAAVDADLEGFPIGCSCRSPGSPWFAIVALAATHPPLLLRALGCGFAGYAIYFALHLVSGGSIGFGDVKLAGVVGLVAGFHGLATVWWSFLAGPLLCLAWAAPTRRGLRDRVAFGPWLVAGLLVRLALT